VLLTEAGLVDDPKRFVCPGATKQDESEDATGEEFQVPTMADLRAASGDRLRRLQRTMGGSYGYHLGFVEGGQHRGVRNRLRRQFALMADVLDPASDAARSCNHGGCGQNVLFEDLHVSYLASCKLSGCGDDYFHNDNGQIADGLHEDDSVIAHSAASPAPASLTRPALFTPDVSLDLAP
jgi:hypothetical protein